MNRKLLIIAFAILSLLTAKAQVGISTTSFLPPANTMLEVKSGPVLTPMGFIMPRFSAGQEGNIGSLNITDHNGWMYYSIAKQKFFYFNGTALLMVNPWWVNQDSSRLIYNPTPGFRVGIGTDSPASTLDVSGTDAIKIPAGTDAQRPASPTAGMIRFNSQLNSLEFYDGQALAWVSVLPPGTIVAFGGITVPAGWLLCNGASVSQATYAKLFTAVGTAWGAPGGGNFNVPDLRGKFLRGVDGTAGFDPDKATRTASNPGGNTGNAVGTYQDDATAVPVTPYSLNTTGNHTHWIANDNGVGGPLNDGPAGTDWDGLGTQHSPGIDANNYDLWGNGATADVGRTSGAGNHTHTISGGDSESRPKNAYVNYIIKY